jgi:hypothetical protein
MVNNMIEKNDYYYKILNEYKDLKLKYPDCYEEYIITFLKDLFATPLLNPILTAQIW